MIQLHIILLGKIDVHCIQVNLYIYKQVTLYIVDQPYQNGWSSVSELINNGLVNVLDGLPTVIYGLLLVRCITDLITSNTPIIITINHIIDMIRHIGILGQPLRNS